MDERRQPTATPGAKMAYLIKRRATTSREELIAHWFANHMPAVVAGQVAQAEKGKSHATRYIATVYSPNSHGAQPWDGMAQLWWDRVLPMPDQPHGTNPTDSFQERAEPYIPWATREYVVMDPSARLPVEPLTLNPPFPCTRSGFHKVSFLVVTKPETDFNALFDHWLTVHVPNVRSVLTEVGGFGYVVSHSIEPQTTAYAGMAELYFPDEASWAEFKATIRPDGIEQWIEPDQTVVLPSGTEMIGIP